MENEQYPLRNWHHRCLKAILANGPRDQRVNSTFRYWLKEQSQTIGPQGHPKTGQLSSAAPIQACNSYV